MIEKYFTPNKNEITYEIIDGEAIIINLLTGYYYNIEGIGSAIWKLMELGISIKEISELILKRFDNPNTESIINEFILQLENEKLIIPINGNGKTSIMELGNEIMNILPGNFIEPKLNSYSDMKDFLLLDPIHDVDKSGWPNKKEENDIKDSSQK